MPSAALKLQGLVAAAFTPMRADGSLDLDRVEAQAEHLVGQSVAGVFVAGTTGEGLSLSVAERQQLAERWCAVAGKRIPVIVHVGHDNLPDAKDLATHAQKAGAAAIAALPPFFYTPRKVQDVVSCCVEIAAAAPRTPFYYYHIPGNTRVSLNVTELMIAAELRLPTLAGLKFSDSDLIAFSRTVENFGDKYDYFFGCDELLLPALAVGAKAAIGSTYNFAAPMYRQMIDAFHSGDLATARRLNTQARHIAWATHYYGGLPAMKATMRLCGLDCGPCRLPLRNLTDQEIESLESALGDALPLKRPEGSEGR